MRISDWSSDVCSSDLALVVVTGGGSMNRDTYDAIQELAVQRGIPGHSLDEKEVMQAYNYLAANGKAQLEAPKIAGPQLARAIMQEAARKSVVYGKSGSVRVDLGGRRIIQKQKK